VIYLFAQTNKRDFNTVVLIYEVFVVLGACRARCLGEASHLNRSIAEFIVEALNDEEAYLSSAPCPPFSFFSYLSLPLIMESYARKPQNNRDIAHDDDDDKVLAELGYVVRSFSLVSGRASGSVLGPFPSIPRCRPWMPTAAAQQGSFKL